MGGKRFQASLCVLLLLVLAACGNEPGEEGINKDDANAVRRAPIAAFTIFPAAGPPGTEFEFDASATIDDQEPTDTLEVRWDYDNDGTWDTAFEADKVARRTYDEVGVHSVKMQARDSDGNTDSVVKQLTIQSPGAPRVSGAIEFEKIPVASQGLDFNNPQYLPARRVLVRSYRASDDVPLGEDYTDEAGAYSVAAEAGQQVYIKAFAWVKDKDLSDNVIGGFAVIPPGDGITVGEDTVYSAKGPLVDMPSDGSDVTGENYRIHDQPNRASGPFNIIDVIEQAYDMMRTVNPDTPLNDLVVRWSRDYDDGTYYDKDENAVYINGNRNADSDEFDDMIVAHEFAHFLENNLYRTDSIGGPHALGEKLDVRVAWSEGYATAFAGMALNTPIYRDSGNVSGGLRVNIDIEDNSQLSSYEGYYNETSVFAILWDLYDDNVENWDRTLAYNYPIFGNIWGDTEYKNDTDLIYLYPFIDKLIDNQGNEPATSAILAEENVPYPEPPENTIVDLGTPPTSVVDVSIDGGLGNDTADYDPWDYNTYGANRFFRFNTGVSRTVRIETTCDSDIDLYVYRKGTLMAAQAGATGNETIEGDVAGDVDYIINVRAWDAGQYTFDLSITLP